MTFVKRSVIPKVRNDLKSLISLSNNNFKTLNDALTNYIQYGIDKIGFEFGAINKVKGNKCHPLKTVSINKMLTKDLVASYCESLYKKVIHTKSTLSSIIEISELYEWSAKKKPKVKAIICTPLIIEQKLYGTLTFCTTKEQEKSHQWDYSINLVEILGHSVSKILKEEIDKNSLKIKSEYLEQFNNDLKEFSRIGVDKYANFSDNLMAYLSFGKKITGFDNAFIGEINNEIYTIIEGCISSCNSKPGDIFQLCDTLCKEAVKAKTTVAYPKLKNSKYYQVLGRIAFKSESSIIVPLTINDKIIGVVRFCSTKEHDDDFKFKYYISIVELIAEKIGELVRQEKILKELKKEKLLLKMGAEVFEMASYSRVLHNNEVYVTPAFSHIFDLKIHNDKKLLHINELINILDEKIIDEDKSWFYENIGRSNAKNINPFEYRIRTQCGGIKWLRHQLRFDKENNCILGVIQNITPIKQAQEKLEIKNTELEQFAYATAHDLQEPLSTINGYCKVLTKTCADKLNKTEKEYFSYMINASNRMREQIDGLLMHSRIGCKKQMELLNMNSLLINVLTDLRSSLNASRTVIIVRDLPDVFGYATEMHLLLLNLISNAIKFTNPSTKPTIEIGYCGIDSHYHTFYVKDNGIGISRENVKKIFKLFARLNKRSEFNGTGIGLAHCQKIVHLHRGKIFVQSELGKGSTFSFTIKK